MSTTVDQKTGFELYLEGIKVPFSSISISEQENSLPTASVQFPATSGATKILPGTIVQIFGPNTSHPNVQNDNKVLLFEGEVSGITYQKGSQGRVAGLECRHLLSQMERATVRPKTAMITSQRRQQEGLADAGQRYFFMDNSSLKGPISNENYKKLLEESMEIFEVDNVTEKLLEEIDVAGYGPFIISFSKLMSGKSEETELISEGELYYFMEFFLRYFERLDPYYGTISRGFKLPESVFTWPNPSRMYPFKTEMILTKSLDALSNLAMQPGSVSNAKLMDAINVFMGTVRYSMSVPAAPTYADLFWRTNNQLGPYRASFMPNLENSPPALCNVFFPGQVSSFNYSRPMGQEATRVVGTFDFPEAVNDYAEGRFNTVTAAPRLELSDEALESNKGGFTEEETYRGINLKTPTFNYFMTKAVQKYLQKEQNGENPKLDFPEDAFHFGKSLNNGTLDGLGDSLQQFTMQRYLKWRYGARVATLQAEWSPYRLVGMQGLVLETNGPSIMGVIASIDTTIDANGSATSTYTLRSPRLIHDEDEEFLQNEGSDSDVFKHAINSFTNDGIQDTNYFLFDPELYNFTNIGSDLYNYLIYGSGSKFGNKLNPEGTKLGFENFKDRIDNMEMSPVKDASILNYVKDEDGNIDVSSILNSDPAEIRYSKILVQAVKELKKVYLGIKDQEPERALKKRLDQINFRRLTAKVDYFDFLGVGFNSDFTNADRSAYKDSVEVFAGLRNTKELEDLIIKSEQKDLKEPSFYRSELNTLQQELDQVLKEKASVDEYLKRMKDGRLRRSSFIAQQINATTQSLETTVGDLKIPKIDLSAVAPVDATRVDSTFGETDVEELLKKEFKDAQNNQSSLDKRSKDLQQRVSELQEKLKQAEDARKAETETKTLESEAFKLYNLIRKAHVELSFRKIRKQGNVNVIKNN